MPQNIHAFNYKLFHIFNYAEITKYYKLVDYKLIGPDLSVYRASALRLNHIHRSLSFNFSFLTLSSFIVYCILCLCKLIYNLLLLFIGNLKIASTWADRITIKDCNNYLPNNLASEINSTSLHCRIVDSSLLSDWPTRSWLIQTLTKLAEIQVWIYEWLIFPTSFKYGFQVLRW